MAQTSDSCRETLKVLQIRSEDEGLFKFEEGRFMINKGRWTKMKLDFANKIIPICELICGIELLKPLKSWSCHIERRNREVLIIWDLVKSKKVVDLEQPSQNILTREERNLDRR